MGLRKLRLGEISSTGWLQKQLDLQAKGLSGNIHKVFDDLGENSAWLGGTGEAWERGPYYLDGLIPLAFITKDEALIERATHWVNCILASENPVFGFGSLRTNDYWPRMVAVKALFSFYRATDDERIVPFLLRYFRFVLDNIDSTGLFYWASARALEAVGVTIELYELTGESFLLELNKKLLEYSYDWKSYFQSLPYPQPMTSYISKILFNLFKNIGEPIAGRARKILKEKTPHRKEKVAAFNQSKFTRLIMLTHAVNIAMAYKYPVYQAMIENKPELASLALKGYTDLMSRHGLSIGLTSGDEHLMGTDASGGVELCSVMEQAYSFEEALRLTRDMNFAELLEFTVFNAMPATFTEDMTAHQYVQQPNQVAADRKKRQFFDVNKEANIFGVAPNFGCCAANMHQGFPKFADNLAYIGEGALHFYAYAPFRLETELYSQKAVIEQTANYPFENHIRFEIHEGDDLKLIFRKPSFALEARQNGETVSSDADTYTVVASKGDVFEIILDSSLSAQKNPDGSISARRNNLLFAMPLEAQESYVRGERPFHYREYTSGNEFAFGLYLNNGRFEIEGEKDGGKTAWFSRDKAPVEILAQGFSAENWKKRKNSAQSPPENIVKGTDMPIRLVPYGCTLLRIAQFPCLEK